MRMGDWSKYLKDKDVFQAHGIASCKGHKTRVCLMHLRNSREEVGLEQSQ